MGTLISLVGFCLQFSGLRSLHFIVSILQLVATIFMTAVRAWLRRGLTEHPTSHKLRNQFELDWFSIRFVAHADGPWQGPVLEIGRPNEIVDDTNGGAKAVTLDQVGSDGNEAGRAELPTDVMDSGVVKSEDINDNMWDIASVTPFKQHQGIWYEKNIAASQPGSAKRVLEVRKRLKTLCGWQGPATNHAISVCTAIRIVLEQLPLDKDIRTRTRFSWTLCTRWKGTEEAITLTVNKDNNNRWNVDENLMEGVISLCLLAHETRMQDPSSNLSTETIPAENAIVMAEAADSEPTSTTRSGEWLLQPDQHIRILGSFSSASQSAFEWWIKDKHGKKAKIFVKTLDAAWLEKGYRSLSLSLSSSQGLGQSPSMSQHQGGASRGSLERRKGIYGEGAERQGAGKQRL
ncbi:hypothetical protein BDD12DRAFT_466562 [Trichophaea hybrida]|nr:hypothetical protein BDD12DRAFT_466562 [Trichophaea hybrida]